MKNGPLAVDMHTVVGNVPARGEDSVALGIEILGPQANRGKECRPRLDGVFAGQVGCIGRGQEACLISLCARQGILQSQSQVPLGSRKADLPAWLLRQNRVLL